jgi:hypothetical protein
MLKDIVFLLPREAKSGSQNRTTKTEERPRVATFKIRRPGLQCVYLIAPTQEPHKPASIPKPRSCANNVSDVDQREAFSRTCTATDHSVSVRPEDIARAEPCSASTL